LSIDEVIGIFENMFLKATFVEVQIWVLNLQVEMKKLYFSYKVSNQNQSKNMLTSAKFDIYKL